MALLEVDVALERILNGVKPLPTELVELHKASGRILAVDIVAKRSQPPFNSSAMDGYAVRQADIMKLPATLTLAGTSAAGHAFKGVVRPGSAIRILTGAPVPKDTDTVIIQENVKIDGTLINILEAAAVGKNIRPAGLDFAKGQVLVPAHTKLTPRDIGVLAAGNVAKVKVFRKPRIVLFTTGDELVLPGQTPRADQIVSSNSHAIEAMGRHFGAEVVNLGIVRDSLKATVVAIKKGLGADILLSTGGASVGDHDYVQEAFKACGVDIAFWKIALRPGKPFMYGRKQRTHVMGLPGNPVSALVTARIFLKPLLMALQGLSAAEAVTTAILDGSLPANDQRRDYVRATMDVASDGQRRVSPFSTQDSSMQHTFRTSQALIIREPHEKSAQSGDLVSILPLDF
jgi:molybdopterin molybdotransferase